MTATAVRPGRGRRTTGRPAARRRARSAVAAAAVVVAVLSLTGCGGLIGSYVNTRQALRDNGFQSVSIHFHPARSGDRVAADVSVAAPPSDNDVRDVASVVWNHLHQRFRLLTVSVKGTGSGEGLVAAHTYTFSDLEAQFGARDPKWNQYTISQSVERVGGVALGGVLALIVVIALLAVLIARRRPRPEPAISGASGRRPTGVPLWPPPSGPPPGRGSPAGWPPPDRVWSPEPSGAVPVAPWPAGGPPTPAPMPASSTEPEPDPEPEPAPPSWPAGPPAPAPMPAPEPTAPAPAPWPAASPLSPAPMPAPSSPAPAAGPPPPPAPPPPAWPRPAELPHPDGHGGWGPPSDPE
jgi:hypothetical protein